MNLLFFMQNVKRLLDERNISYSRAGRESGAGIDFVRNMERKNSWPSIEKVALMADYLGITVGELLGEELPRAGPNPKECLPYLAAGTAPCGRRIWGGNKKVRRCPSTWRC